MARPRRVDEEETPIPRTRRRATTTEQRENIIVGLTMDLAERQIREGSASSQVMTHFLKLGTVREEIERDNLRSTNKLLQARVDSLQSAGNSEKLYMDAIAAMTQYRPEETPDDFIE